MTSATASGVRAALANWARSAGEAADYTENVPAQCLHPVGHWIEVPNLLKNGTLARLLAQQPQLRTLLVHNVDTLGATLDPALIGWFHASGSTLVASRNARSASRRWPRAASSVPRVFRAAADRGADGRA